MNALLIIPQAWVLGPETLPESWFTQNAPGLCRVWPDAPSTVNRVATDVGVSAKLLVTRMELEQSACSYAWDGSTDHYRDEGPDVASVWPDRHLFVCGLRDAWKLTYLCGVDKTDAGPRENGWFGPERQCYGCALRFKFWYRGNDWMVVSEDSVGSSEWVFGTVRDGAWPPSIDGKNWLHIGESADVREDYAPEGFATGKPVIRSGKTLVPANQASADCLRYTTNLAGSERLAQIGRGWFPDDYAREEQGGNGLGTSLKIVLDPGHGTLGSDGKRDTGTGACPGVVENEANLEIAIRMRDMLTAHGHTVYMTREKQDYGRKLGPTARGQFAASKKADVFVSVHHDGGKASMNGCHGFYHDERAPNGMRLAHALAVALHEEFTPEGLAYSYGAPSSDWFGNQLGVLKGGDNWAITGAAALVECMFMSNTHDQAIIKSGGYYERAAEALCKGIYVYAGIALPVEWSEVDDSHSDEPVTPDNPTDEPVTPWEKELAAAVEWARSKAVSDGTRLGDAVTRGEVLVMLRRALGGE